MILNKLLPEEIFILSFVW